MSDPPQGTQDAAAAGAPKAPPPPKQGNPAFRMMGLPRLRAKLPSRNWTIFLTVVGSFSGAVIYDRRQKRRAQQHWCDAVSHLSREHLRPDQLPRKLTVYLAAPPGDGLRPSREFFVEYVKPILVAAAVDWEVVEGRREGDVRAELANKIRKSRIKQGEQVSVPVGDESEDLVAEIRQRSGIEAGDKRGGDLVLGRHTWKEYVRGLHEGWLGPLEAPRELGNVQDETASLSAPESQPSFAADSPDISPAPSSDQTADGSILDDPKDADPSALATNAAQEPSKEEEQKPAEKEPEKKPKSKLPPTPPYILPTSYANAEVAPSLPTVFNPSVPLSEPHLLGFFNTPIRIYRFLTRRRVADSTGQQVASFLLASDSRPFQPPLTGSPSVFAGDDANSDPASVEQSGSPDAMWESQVLLQAEEQGWHKSARQPNKEGEESTERPWKEPMILDLRIAERMRTPDAATVVLPAADPTAEQREEGAAADTGTLAAHYRGWTGGADPVLRNISWWKWFVEATGFDDPREPQGLGAKDGFVDDEI